MAEIAKTRIETTTGVLKSDLEKKIVRYKADPDYISHVSTKEDLDGNYWTLTVTLKAN